MEKFVDSSEIMKGMYENGINIEKYIEILTNIYSFIFEIFKEAGVFPKTNNANADENMEVSELRSLSINRQEKKFKVNNRRMGNTELLLCKLDGTFPENGIYTANPENINSFILKSSSNYDNMVKSNIGIKIDKDMASKCARNNIPNIYSNTQFKNISTLNIDVTKKRFTFTIKARISPTFKIPFFYYLMIKGSTVIKEKNLRILDTEEEISIYCLLEDETDRDNAAYNCFGYNDNINENSANNKITLCNLTSEYIQLPKDLSVTNMPETEENSNSESTPTSRNRLFVQSKSSGLSTGAIVGIVLACVAVLVGVTGILIYLKKKPNKPNPNDITDSRYDFKISNTN